MKRYIAKATCWFDTGTEADLIEDYRPDVQAGVFFGMKDGKLAHQICNFQEFKITLVRLKKEEEAE